MFGKKIGILFAGLMLMSTFVITPVSAFADMPDTHTTKDSTYTINFNGWFQRDNTSWRPKDKPWSTYLRVDRATKTSMRLYVDGAYNSGGSGALNLTIGGYVWSPGPGKYEIHNNVYETGRRWARLGASSDRGPSYLAGLWSPDCAGYYKDLN